MRIMAIGLLAPLIVSGCARTAANRTAGTNASNAMEAGAVRDSRNAQNRAIAAGNADLAATFWTEDVTIRRALGQDVRGRNAYRQLVVPGGNRDSSLVYQRDPTSIEVSASFPLAFETGTWRGHLGGIAGPEVIGGRYSAQWVKRDGRWLIRSEVFVALTCSGVGCSYPAVP
jgi:ketosteroid isomerase-like protein